MTGQQQEASCQGQYAIRYPDADRRHQDTGNPHNQKFGGHQGACFNFADLQPIDQTADCEWRQNGRREGQHLGRAGTYDMPERVARGVRQLEFATAWTCRR